MLIFPAVDLRRGHVVRLTEGDYDRMTVYGDDPLATAKAYKAAGAEYLHVVDLDAAKDGAQKNLAVIQKLAAESGLKLEVGGGVRDLRPLDQSCGLHLLRGTSLFGGDAHHFRVPQDGDRLYRLTPGRAFEIGAGPIRRN